MVAALPELPEPDRGQAAAAPSGLFPPASADRTPFRLAPAQCEQFARDGFLIGVPVLDHRQLLAVRAAVQAVIDDLEQYRPRLYEVERAFTDRPSEVVCHFLGGWLVQQVLHDLVFHPAATVPCAQLLAVERLRFWHDQVFAKPPRHAGVVPWHQDYAYWQRTAPACHVTVNVMLDDADAHSGCLQFVPGSHRWGLLPKLPFDAPLEAILPHLPPGAAFRPVLAPLPAGAATIHHSHTLHGSDRNRSDRWRRAVVLNYMGAHVRVADGTAPLLHGVPLLPAGAEVAGRHFPIVLAPRPG
ncbi:MAG TPA: phytanoyl-CoA dioxygenase family protein [Planctomycetota bacterium]|nr:phytanoyl-CoA dioxygenase family protein [Planctomycetota bacterium]